MAVVLADMVESIRSIQLDFPAARRTVSGAAEPPSGILPYFVVGPENLSILDLFSPQGILEIRERSPMVFYGASGVGKSVLAMTLAGRWSMAVSPKQITVVSASDFGRLFALAIQSDDMERFRQRHRQCQFFLMDGLQDLVGKDTAQEELVCTLDELLERQCPVVVVSSKLPGAIRGLRPALASRLMGGCSFEIRPPGVQARSIILDALNQQMGSTLSHDELRKLANQLPDESTAIQLRGVLMNWLHQQRVVQEPREEALRHVIENQHLAIIPSIQDIAKAVSRSLGVKLSDMRGDTRKSNVVRARGLAMWLARQWTTLSLQQIGEFFGGRDHTTVLHACRKTEGDIKEDLELSRSADEIRQKLR